MIGLEFGTEFLFATVHLGLLNKRFWPVGPGFCKLALNRCLILNPDMKNVTKKLLNTCKSIDL